MKIILYLNINVDKPNNFNQNTRLLHLVLMTYNVIKHYNSINMCNYDILTECQQNIDTRVNILFHYYMVLYRSTNSYTML